MASTRVYSTAAYWVAGIAAILLSLSPKFGEVINSVPAGVLGGVTTALYGLIGVIGIKIWVDNRVDFSRPVNQYTAAVALIMAVGGFMIKDEASGFELGGIVIATVAANLIYHLGNLIARLRKTGADDPKPLEAVGPLGGDPRLGVGLRVHNSGEARRDSPVRAVLVGCTRFFLSCEPISGGTQPAEHTCTANRRRTPGGS